MMQLDGYTVDYIEAASGKFVQRSYKSGKKPQNLIVLFLRVYSFIDSNSFKMKSQSRIEASSEWRRWVTIYFNRNIFSRCHDNVESYGSWKVENDFSELKIKFLRFLPQILIENKLSSKSLIFFLRTKYFFYLYLLFFKRGFYDNKLQ